jgi:hypothetical protein
MRSPGLGQGYHSRRAPALCLTGLGYGVGFMGCIENGNIAIRGNLALARRCENVRPKNWDHDYKAIVPYFFKWRDKICGIICACKEIIEAHQSCSGRNGPENGRCAAAAD